MSGKSGEAQIFIDDADALVRPIDDNEELLPQIHKKSHPIQGLPTSLMEAIRAFVIARAIRVLRGQGAKHSSMLINVSRFTDVQTSLRNEVHERLRVIQDAARTYGALPPSSAEGNETIAALKSTFESEYGSCGGTWPQVLAKLHEAAAPVRVIEVNSRSGTGLDYAEHKDTGLSVIAVGGFSLSRGLTLEGLIVSYFLRNSMMYDTLMQMGRWFGYRPGYDDLCRIWMPEDAQGWYEHIAQAIEELRDELKAMEAVKATPKEFGLKVRSHPDTLIVTARNKMGTGKKLVMRIGLGKSFIETAVLKAGTEFLEANQDGARRFVQDLRNRGIDPAKAREIAGGYLLEEVPAAAVVDYIRGFRNSEGSFATDPQPVAAYIEERAGDELEKWQVLFASLKNDGKRKPDALLGIDIFCQVRSIGDNSSDKTIFVSSKQRVSSRGVEKSGLSQPQVKEAEATYLAENPEVAKAAEKAGKPVNFPDHAYRAVRKSPLLIIHLLHLEESAKRKIQPPAAKPVIAWSISFPETQRPDARVEYIVGAVWLKENMPEEVDDDLGGDA